MAVIITDMDMPSRCDECPLVVNSECPLIGIDVDEEMGSRDMNCPLKSADEMIEKIKALGTWSRSLGNVTIPYHRVENIIHKYTYKEQEDGNDNNKV